MLVNCSKEIAPDSILDIIPESEEEGALLMEFLSQFTQRADFARVQVEPVQGEGLLITVA